MEDSNLPGPMRRQVNIHSIRKHPHAIRTPPKLYYTP